MIITIDGPAGAGKSTVGRRLAERLGFRFLETGIVYRALAFQVWEAQISPQDRETIIQMAQKIVDLSPRPEYYRPEISRLASQLSADPKVREALLKIQKQFGQHGNLVAEGRDTGSVIFPQAEVKFFLKASLAERARRRHADLKTHALTLTLEQVQEEIAERDRRDMSRNVSPLTIPEGAFVVDTTHLSIEEVVELLLREINKKKRTNSSSSPQKPA